MLFPPEIIQDSNGKVIEQGMHDELYALKAATEAVL